MPVESGSTPSLSMFNGKHEQITIEDSDIECCVTHTTSSSSPVTLAFSSVSRAVTVARELLPVACGKAELWLSPVLSCSNLIFWRNPGEIPLTLWGNSDDIR